MKSPLFSRFPDPEPPEAQEGQEEAAEAGGKAGYTGPAPEDAREAQHGHGMRRESGYCPSQAMQLGFLQILLLSRVFSSACQAGIAARTLGVGQTAGQS